MLRLAAKLPEVGYTPPRAGYLTWLDLRPLELGDDPCEALLERGRVALNPGPTFGPQGEPCAHCGSLLARDQPYFLECGTRLAGMGAEPSGESPAELAMRIKAEYERWGEVVRKANIKAD